MARRKWAREEVKYLKENWGTLTLVQICEELKRSYTSVKCKVFKLGLDYSSHPKKEYALYKGEQMIAIGTIREIAEERGVRVQTIYHYNSNAYKKRIEGNENRLVLFAIED